MDGNEEFLDAQFAFALRLQGAEDALIACGQVVKFCI
jgi:hypothetical protein